MTVYSPVKISPDEAFETFVSILRVQGYAVQKSGSAYKIVPLKEGLGQGEDAPWAARWVPSWKPWLRRSCP